MVEQLSTPVPGQEGWRAHFKLLLAGGAGAWLQAVPNAALDLHADALLFRTMVQMRLRLAVTVADGPCPLCDGVADRFGDHARCCPCGGDRTKRDNRLRTVLASRAQAAGLHVEVEKPRLLPPRLDAEGAPETGVPNPAGRRPADIWVANWGIHGPAALDLAVTCGLRPGQLPQAAAAEGAWAVGPATDYEARKRAHLNTAQLCAEQGLQFLPIVAEGSGGGWGPTAQKVFAVLGRALAARSGELAAIETDRLGQAMSFTLQRENARAVLRRRAVDCARPACLPAP